MATLDPVVIEFVLKGFAGVQRAFDSLAKTAASTESQWTRSSESAARVRMKAAHSEAKAKEASAKRVEKAREKAERDATRAAAQESKRREREADKAARASIKAEEKRAREVKRIADREERERKQHLRAMVREEEKANRERLALEQKLGRERERVARSLYGAGAKGVARVARIGSRVGLGIARSVMQVGGGFGAADSVQREMEASGAATALAAQTAGNTGPNRISGAAILQRAKEVSRASVVDQRDVIAAMDAFKMKTGNLGMSQRLVGDMAKLSNATGADLGELMSTAGSISAGNTSMKEGELTNIMRVFAKQGQMGTVEVKDLAKYGSRLVAGAGLFEGGQAKNLGTMGAFAQLATQKGGASSAAEAAMAAQRFATDIQKHAGDLQSDGIRVKTKSGLLRDPTAILMDMVKKTGGDVTRASQMHLGDRGVKILTGATRLYNEAGKGEAGEAAVKKFFSDMTGGTSAKEIDAAEKERLAATDKQLEAVMQQLRMEVGQALLPELQKLIPLIREWTPKLIELLQEFSKWIAWASKNPWTALIATLTASLGVEVAKAKIADIIKQMLLKAGGGGGGGGAPGVPGVGGGPGNVSRAIGTGILAGEVIYNSGSKYGDGMMAADDLAAKVRAWGRGDRENGIAPAAASKMLNDAQGRLGRDSVLGQVGNIIASPINESASKDYARYKADQALVDSKDLVAAIRESTAATKQLAQAQRGGGGMPDASRHLPINQRGGAQ